MPRTAAADGPARPDAAALNERIRAFTRGRTWWSAEALRELRVLQTAYLEAQRAEGLGRGDVTAVA